MVAAQTAPFAISAGDPAGIGPEIIGKAWQERNNQKLHPFFAIGDADIFPLHWHGPISVISNPSEAIEIFDDALPIIDIGSCNNIHAGKPNISGAHIAFQALEHAVGLARAGHASAVITAPVCKKQLYDVGFTHAGQTEFIAERCGVSKSNAIMMLAGPTLRVVPVTTHIPLHKISETLTFDMVKNCIISTRNGLIRSFGIDDPIIAFAGVNPHAGEDGAMGHEEITLLRPVIEELNREGYKILGPLPADTIFHAEARTHYDAAICCYHDQALIPLKTLYFHEAVNLTLGLPIIRTSPDHGTAFDIAGQNIARADSMIAAIHMAENIAQHRDKYEQSLVAPR